MSWYKFSKDYVNSILSKPDDNTSAGLENSIDQERKETTGFMPLNTWMALNSTPDTFKAEGAGGLYINKDHNDNNMPEGDDNFVDPSYWNE